MAVAGMACAASALAPPLLLCSISEALARSSGHASSSTGLHWNQHTSADAVRGATSFRESKCAGACWKLLRSTPTPKSCQSPTDPASLTLSSYTVQPRRHQQLPRKVQFFLSADPAALDARRLATSLQAHLVSRFAFLMAAHHALQSQLENYIKPMARLQSFFRLLRHPGERLGERRGGLHGSGSASARECSGPRPAQRLAESALVKERSLDLAEAAELFERAAEACEAAGDRASAAEYWSRASKQWSDMTYVPGTSDERAVAVNHKAIELGNRSVEADASQVSLPACVCLYMQHRHAWHPATSRRPMQSHHVS